MGRDESFSLESQKVGRLDSSQEPVLTGWEPSGDLPKGMGGGSGEKGKEEGWEGGGWSDTCPM